MVEITGYSKETKLATIETDDGKIRVSFDEWKQLVKAYYLIVENKRLD